MSSPIINRGRGPELAGTRITVYDVMDYLRTGWSLEDAAVALGVSGDQIGAAAEYIRQHEADLVTAHDRIRARDAAGNTPDVKAKLEASRAKLKQLLRDQEQHPRSEPARVRSPG